MFFFHAISVLQTDECRTIHCPSGQIHDFRGRCKFPSKLWLSANYQIALNLTTEHSINKTDIQIVSEHLLDSKFTFNSPWPKHWYIWTIYFLLPSADDEYISLIIFINNKLYQVRPSLFMRAVKTMVNAKWTFIISNKTFIFTSEFSPFYIIPKCTDCDEHFVNQTNKGFDFQYHQIFKVTDFLSGYHPITKLYLCNQVILTPDEFSLTSKGNILYNNITNCYLFWSEFLLLNSASGVESAKVCIEDSGLKELIYQSAISSVGLHIGIFQLVTFVLITYQMNRIRFNWHFIGCWQIFCQFSCYSCQCLYHKYLMFIS